MHKRSSIMAGTILILVGALFLFINLFPEVAARLNMGRQWPLLIVAVGVFFLLSAAVGTPSLAVPGSVLAGIGGILYYQNLSGNWASWAYIWALIPGFVGIGLIMSSLFGERKENVRREGGRLLIISLILFAVFAAFFNGLGGLEQFWPLLLIMGGLWLLFAIGGHVNIGRTYAVAAAGLLTELLVAR